MIVVKALGETIFGVWSVSCDSSFSMKMWGLGHVFLPTVCYYFPLLVPLPCDCLDD